jgi:hypothetical protein
MDDMEDAIFQTRCGHKFHQECMTLWSEASIALTNTITCPMCREVLHENPCVLRDVQSVSLSLIGFIGFILGVMIGFNGVSGFILGAACMSIGWVMGKMCVRA